MVKLHVDGGTDTEPGSGGYIVTGSITGTNISMDNNEIMARNNGAVSTLFLNNDGGDVVAGGTFRCDVLEIVGADLAEKFEFSEEAKPGMVVAIDEKNPGKLCVAKGAYNPCLAGVVSGANQLKAGVVMSRETGSGHAVALSGRVWVYCDATKKEIKPGTMLTSANEPGYAMPVLDHKKAQGAILGKAMTGLKKGEKGMVLVLVNLQ
jgi:hypothetical protein